MRRIIAALALAVASLLPVESFAKPPSFAVWASKEAHYASGLTNPVLDGCSKLSSDAKAGACAVKGLLMALPKADVHWKRGIARIARGQTRPCMTAIRAYSLAAGRHYRALLRYLTAHPGVSATNLNSDTAGEPYATLDAAKDETKSRAIRVCG